RAVFSVSSCRPPSTPCIYTRSLHDALPIYREEVLGEVVDEGRGRAPRRASVDVPRVVLDPRAEPDLLHHLDVVARPHAEPLRLEDRKSTRLNSSHVSISYAVFCLKKKRHHL